MVDDQWSSGTIYITPHMDIPFSEIVHDVAKILQEKGFTTVLYPPSEKSNIPRRDKREGLSGNTWENHKGF